MRVIRYIVRSGLTRIRLPESKICHDEAEGRWAVAVSEFCSTFCCRHFRCLSVQELNPRPFCAVGLREILYRLMSRAFLGSAATIRSIRYHRSPISPSLAEQVITSSPSTMADSVKPHHPSLEIVGGATDSFLPALKILTSGYKPYPVIGWNRHVETIFGSLFRYLPDVRFRRECLPTKDGGVVSLDWVSGDDRPFPSHSPTLILLPGLTGGSDVTYVRHMLIRVRNHGWRAVVLNSRGCADSPVITPQFYSASFIEDIREVVAHVGSRYPKSNLYAVGWSVGANILVRYLGQETDEIIPLSGAVSLCNPFNLVIANEDFPKGFNNTYNKSLANALSKMFKKHASLFEDIGGEYNIRMAANAKTVREFDEGLTRVSFGFKSADDYYFNSSSSDCVKYVRTPLLCIQAANDPIAPYRAIPFEDIKENPNCMLIVTPKGGHLGWIAGGDAPLGAPWTNSVVMDFLLHLEIENFKADSPRSNETKVEKEGFQVCGFDSYMNEGK